MEALLYLLWFVVALPALPLVGLWSLAWGPSHGTSGQMGLFFVASFVGGIVIWCVVIAWLFFGTGHLPIPHLVWT